MTPSRRSLGCTSLDGRESLTRFGYICRTVDACGAIINTLSSTEGSVPNVSGRLRDAIKNVARGAVHIFRGPARRPLAPLPLFS